MKIEVITFEKEIFNTETNLTVGNFFRTIGIDWIDFVDKSSVKTFHLGLRKNYCQRIYQRTNVEEVCVLKLIYEGYLFSHEEYSTIKDKILSYKQIGAGI